MTIPEHADPALRRLAELPRLLADGTWGFALYRLYCDTSPERPAMSYDDGVASFAADLAHALQRIAALEEALPGALRFMEAHHECDACASENITDIMPQCDDCGEAGYCAKRVLDALRRAARVLSPEEGR